MNPGTQLICPLCKDSVDKLVFRFHIDSERPIIDRIKADHSDWGEDDGACSRCIDYYHTAIVREQQLLPEIGPHFPVKCLSEFVILPTGLRVNAHPRFTGRGVTICFIDSGFFLHPDLITHRNRIKKVVDITAAKTKQKYFSEPHPESWHGTMTTVVCAGDGYLSKGLYKGIASDAELVLLKVQNADGRITGENIVKALEWVSKNHKKYGIRIVNLSLGDDMVCSYKESRIDQLAEQLIEKGITLVAAVGNDENSEIKPPANSPNVIAVGGIDDNNMLEEGNINGYHSTYGKTIDGFMKPELVAQAIWIAAPILPLTKEHHEANILEKLAVISEGHLLAELSKHIQQTQLDPSLLNNTDEIEVKKEIIQRITNGKFISPHYMHVDGTSFAAPIVSSVIAQLLEANPSLTPGMIREILFSTSKRSEHIEAIRQGFGIIQPRKALLKILKLGDIMNPNKSPNINTEKKTISFHIQHECAEEISLAGNFNHWAQDVLLFEPGKNGHWTIEIPLLPNGRYQYKFLIDNKVWIEDVNNPYREPDGFSGFNSILLIEN